MAAAIIAFVLTTISLMLVALWFYLAAKFDERIERIYNDDRERWRSLGEPIGVFWQPEEQWHFFRSTNARTRAYFLFLLRAKELQVNREPSEPNRAR
jgi:hypothetical protein